MHDSNDAVAGALLGGAVGDALGLPYEGMAPARAARLLGPPDRYRFVFGRGMVSDDTEHACMALQSYCDYPDDPIAFAGALAWRLRWWLLALPVAGGRATVTACLKLWLGFGPNRSGVFSAGNGPAMRAAVLGAAIDDLSRLRRYSDASCRLTHTDPKALAGAFAVALAAWCAQRGRERDFLAVIAEAGGLDQPELAERLRRAVDSAAAGESTEAFAKGMCGPKGVSGYILDTVPVAVHAWQRHPHDLDAGVQAAIRCGGDTDTIAAIVGGIVGTAVGAAGIPAPRLDRLHEWPRSVAWMRRLAAAAVRRQPPPRANVFAVVARNAYFFAVVLVHIARRLLPPYGSAR